MIPIAMIYNTPEDATAEIAYLEKRGYPISYVEMGEEPDGHYTDAGRLRRAVRAVCGSAASRGSETETGRARFLRARTRTSRHGRTSREERRGRGGSSTT